MEVVACHACQSIRRVAIRCAARKFSKSSQDEFQSWSHCPRWGANNSWTKSEINCPERHLSLYKAHMVLSSVPSWYGYKSFCLKKEKSSLTWCQVRYLKTVSSDDLKGWAQNSREIERYLRKHSCPYTAGHTCYKAWCVSCYGKPLQKNIEDETDVDSRLTCLINKTTGTSICSSCGIKESWSALKERIKNASPIQHPDRDHHVIAYDHKAEIYPADFDAWENANLLTNVNHSKQETLCSLLKLQKISLSSLNDFKVHASQAQVFNHNGSEEFHDCLLFPYYDITKSVVIGLKKISSLSSNHVFVGDQKSSLFGWHLISPTCKEVVLVSSELDALAVYEATGTPTLSLPAGCSTLSPEVLPLLEQFDRITLWFKKDLHSRQLSFQFAKKLRLERCHQVRYDGIPEGGGAFELLNLTGAVDAVKEVIAGARRMSHDRILTFAQLRDELYDNLEDAEQIAGVKFTRFPELTDILKGHRRGEVTIFTGPTGSGKTTFLSELSLDLCSQGVNTLWGSFEIKNVRLAKIMLSQFAGLSVEKRLHEYPYWADCMEDLPIYFMSYYGSHELKEVLKTIRHAVYAYDIEHVIIDNLQFMLPTINSRDDRFSAMNTAIASFRKCASDNNIHITLVIHPRKENAGNDLQTASIYGTAKASQEADNIIILQSSQSGSVLDEDEKYLQVTKNRFDGTLGTVPLSFNKDSLCMSGFHRNVETREAILPKLRKKRAVRLAVEMFDRAGYSDMKSRSKDDPELRYVLSRLRVQNEYSPSDDEEDDTDTT